jgi:hypothetical protein
LSILSFMSSSTTAVASGITDIGKKFVAVPV